MTQNLTPAQRAQLDNRDTSGKFTEKTHSDVEDTADVLGFDGGDVVSDKWGPFVEMDRQATEDGEDSGYDDCSDRAVAVVKDQEITGVSRIGEPSNDPKFGRFAPTDHRVTLSKPDGSQVEFPFIMGAAHGTKPPSTAHVIGSVADEAALVENTDSVEEFARETGFDPVDQIDEPEGWEQMQRDYQHIKDNGEALREFIGDEAFERIKWGED